MSAALPSVPLREAAQPVSRTVTPSVGETYRQLGVRLWGQGAYEREPLDGGLTKYQQIFRAQYGDIVVNKIWARNGSVAVVDEALSGCHGSNEFPMFAPIPDRLDARWMHWITKTRDFWTQCDEKSRGTSGQNRIRPDRFLDVKIPLPPLNEQRRIVARIEELTAKVEEAHRLRAGSIDEIQAIASAYTTNLVSSLDSYPQTEISSLGPNGDNPIQIGPFGAQLHASEFVPEGIPVLNVGNVWPTGLRLDSLDYVTPTKAADLARYTIKTDDLLFARSGATLGKVCLVPPACDGWLMTGHLFRVRFDPSVIDKRFAFAGLRGARQIHDQVFGQVRGATRPGYNTTLLGAVKLPVPPLSEQRRIIAELDALQTKVDSVRALQSETAAELDAMLPAILDKAFKGEL